MRYAALLLGVLVATPVDAESWLCTADASVGFNYQNATHEWKPLMFRADSKYVVRRPTEEELQVINSLKWVVVPVGETTPIVACQKEIDEDGWLSCALLHDFLINVKSLKFMATYHGHFFFTREELSEEDGPDSPFMEIGRCTSL